VYTPCDGLTVRRSGTYATDSQLSWLPNECQCERRYRPLCFSAAQSLAHTATMSDDKFEAEGDSSSNGQRQSLYAPGSPNKLFSVSILELTEIIHCKSNINTIINSSLTESQLLRRRPNSAWKMAYISCRNNVNFLTKLQWKLQREWERFELK